jgi:lipid II:glycine glycyltransferase (peptidoglycan interpeptide bridge formation enzyme)
MINITYRKKIRITHVWFCDDKKYIKSNGDIIFLHGYGTKNSDGIVSSQYTLITNLETAEDELWQGINKNVRYEIRRANKEGIITKQFNGKEILKNKDIINKFENIYNQMYLDKGIDSKFNRSLFYEYAKNNSIIVTVAYHDQTPLVFHSYIMDNENARFFYSTSPFRQDNEQRNLIARMNKLLHWSDLLMFKSGGILKYDWGGINNPDSPNSIAQFKLKFPGKVVEYYNIQEGRTLLGRIAIKILKYRNKLV